MPNRRISTRTNQEIHHSDPVDLGQHEAYLRSYVDSNRLYQEGENTPIDKAKLDDILKEVFLEPISQLLNHHNPLSRILIDSET